MTSSKNKLSGKPEWFVLPETIKVMEALNGEGGEARFVGGCVLDSLVNRKTFDIDIAVNLEPKEVIKRLEKNKIKAIPTGIDHGTVTAVVNGHAFEITTLREDVETFGRHATVKFTKDWEVDAKRRDFTINTLSANIDGEVFDYCGGIEDLRLGRVRFVGNAEDRVKEDYLRILRFFRFYAFFGQGEADSEALQACKTHAEQLKTISAERIGNEILKTLESNNIVKVWKLLSDCGVLQVVLPEARNIEALERLVELEEKFENKTSVARRLAVLLSDDKTVAEKLKLSNNQAKEISLLREDFLLRDIKDIHLVVYKEGNDVARSVLLMDAANNGESKNLRELYDAATSFRAPRLPVTGDDVIEAGITEGIRIGNILRSVEAWWIENSFIPKRVECLEKIKELSE